MKQDAFERLYNLVADLEAAAKTKADEQMMDGIRAGIDVVERLVLALEAIAANTTPDTVTCDAQTEIKF